MQGYQNKRLLLHVAILSCLSIFVSSCTRHAPAEEAIRNLCTGEFRKKLDRENLNLGEASDKNRSIEVVEIIRKGIGESKNTRGIPDNTLVYPIACLMQTNTNGTVAEPETLFLYFFRNSDAVWQVRARK